MLDSKNLHHFEMNVMTGPFETAVLSKLMHAVRVTYYLTLYF